MCILNTMHKLFPHPIPINMLPWLWYLDFLIISPPPPFSFSPSLYFVFVFVFSSIKLICTLTMLSPHFWRKSPRNWSVQKTLWAGQTRLCLGWWRGEDRGLKGNVCVMANHGGDCWKPSAEETQGCLSLSPSAVNRWVIRTYD